MLSWTCKWCLLLWYSQIFLIVLKSVSLLSLGLDHLAGSRKDWISVSQGLLKWSSSIELASCDRIFHFGQAVFQILYFSLEDSWILHMLVFFNFNTLKRNQMNLEWNNMHFYANKINTDLLKPFLFFWYHKASQAEDGLEAWPTHSSLYIWFSILFLILMWLALVV